MEPKEGLTGEVLDVEHIGVPGRAFGDGVKRDPGSNRRHPYDRYLPGYRRGVGAQCSGLTKTMWMKLYQIFDRAAFKY